MLVVQGVMDGGVGGTLFSLDVLMELRMEMLPWQDGCEGSWVTGTCLSKHLGSELGLGSSCHSSGLSYLWIGVCCLSSIFSPLDFCQGNHRAAHGSSNLS